MLVLFIWILDQLVNFVFIDYCKSFACLNLKGYRMVALFSFCVGAHPLPDCWWCVFICIFVNSLGRLIDVVLVSLIILVWTCRPFISWTEMLIVVVRLMCVFPDCGLNFAWQFVRQGWYLFYDWWFQALSVISFCSSSLTFCISSRIAFAVWSPVKMFVSSFFARW